MAIFGYLLKIESVQKVIDYILKMKKPTDRRHMQLRPEFFLFLGLREVFAKKAVGSGQ